MKSLFLTGDQWKECGRRVPRAALGSELHPVWITFPELSAMRFPVSTLGELGCYCVAGAAGLPVAVDHMVDVVLTIDDDRFTFEGRIRYVHDQGIAVEFVHPQPTVRERIRKLFEAEFLATTLAPLVSYDTVEPGSSGTLIYSDGDSNNLHVALSEKKIFALSLDLKILGLHVEWKRTRDENLEAEPLTPDLQKRVLNFVRNLPGIDSGFLKEMESIITSQRFRALPEPA